MFTKAQDSSVSLNYLPYINNAIRGRHRMPASYYIIWDVTKSPDPDVTRILFISFWTHVGGPGVVIQIVEGDLETVATLAQTLQA